MIVLQSSNSMLAFLTPVLNCIAAAARAPEVQIAIVSLVAGLAVTAFSAFRQVRRPVRTPSGSAPPTTDAYPQWLF